MGRVLCAGQQVWGRQRARGHLCARGGGVADHGLQHVGGHNDGLAALPAPLHDAALPVGHLRAPTPLTSPFDMLTTPASPELPQPVSSAVDWKTGPREPCRPGRKPPASKISSRGGEGVMPRQGRAAGAPLRRAARLLGRRAPPWRHRQRPGCPPGDQHCPRSLSWPARRSTPLHPKPSAHHRLHHGCAQDTQLSSSIVGRAFPAVEMRCCCGHGAVGDIIETLSPPCCAR